jgi:hypothetical protein
MPSLLRDVSEVYRHTKWGKRGGEIKAAMAME